MFKQPYCIECPPNIQQRGARSAMISSVWPCHCQRELLFYCGQIQWSLFIPSAKASVSFRYCSASFRGGMFPKNLLLRSSRAKVLWVLFLRQQCYCVFHDALVRALIYNKFPQTSAEWSVPGSFRGLRPLQCGALVWLSCPWQYLCNLYIYNIYILGKKKNFILATSGNLLWTYAYAFHQIHRWKQGFSH